MPEQTKYWAHSSGHAASKASTFDGWQSLAAHLEQTSAICRELAFGARPGSERFAELASVAGLLHDFGKYTPAFQQMLLSGRGRCQHSIHGALAAFHDLRSGQTRPGLRALVMSLMGHHAGLSNSSTWGIRLKDPKYLAETRAVLDAATDDSAALCGILTRDHLGVLPFSGAENARFDLLTRMLFSCLVDADRLDSAGRRPVQAPLRAAERLNTLLDHLSALAGRGGETAVNRIRQQILRDCLEAAASEASLFSLSVPTGGGKTLAAMAFALRRAVLHPEQFRRVIVVIPYLSIIEQNAKVYADILGADAILEHHSGNFAKLQPALKPASKDSHLEEDRGYVPRASDDDEGKDGADDRGAPRFETENWDAPIVVTTSVRFFESLFSNSPRDLRRVHNIARSIVILDEVQTLPRKLLAPLLGMIRELADDWGVTFVLSTATQPTFEVPPGQPANGRWESGTLTEIIKEPAPLHQALKRVEIQWEIEQPIGWPAVATRALEGPQCLAIVNLKRHACELFAEVRRQAKQLDLDPAGLFHLSTRMCAAHRLRVLDRIRGRLKSGQTCYVVSTQLVEAGVDLDFPLVLRALAPLDSIVQAAGRADREGCRTAASGRPGGRLVVFQPEDPRMPPNEYEEATDRTKILAFDALKDGRTVQVDSLEAMSHYFNRYYETPGTTGEELAELRQGTKCQFETLAQEFEIISNRTRDVFVPDDEDARAALAELREKRCVKSELRRRLQRHVVGLNPSEFERAGTVIERLIPDQEVWIAPEQAYDDVLGLVVEIGAEKRIL